MFSLVNLPTIAQQIPPQGKSCKAEASHVDEESTTLHAMYCRQAAPRHVALHSRRPFVTTQRFAMMRPRKMYSLLRTSLRQSGWSHADLILSGASSRRSRGGLFPSRFRFPIVCANRCASARHGFLGEGAPILHLSELATSARPESA